METYIEEDDDGNETVICERCERPIGGGCGCWCVDCEYPIGECICYIEPDEDE